MRLEGRLINEPIICFYTAEGTEEINDRRLQIGRMQTFMAGGDRRRPEEAGGGRWSPKRRPPSHETAGRVTGATGRPTQTPATSKFNNFPLLNKDKKEDDSE